MVPPSARNRSSTSHSWRRDCGSRPGRRLVEKQQLGPAGQRARHRQPLLLPARQLRHPRVALRRRARRCRAARRPSGRADRTIGTARSVSATVSLSASWVSCSWMPSRGRSAARVAVPPLPEHLDLAGVGGEQAFEDLDGGRLAGAVRPEQAEALAAPHFRSRPSTAVTVPYRLTTPDATAGQPRVTTQASIVAVVHSPFCVVAHCLDRTSGGAARPAGAARPRRRSPDLHRRRGARGARSHHPHQAGAGGDAGRVRGRRRAARRSSTASRTTRRWRAAKCA